MTHPYIPPEVQDLIALINNNPVLGAQILRNLRAMEIGKEIVTPRHEPEVLAILLRKVKK